MMALKVPAGFGLVGTLELVGEVATAESATSDVLPQSTYLCGVFIMVHLSEAVTLTISAIIDAAAISYISNK